MSGVYRSPGHSGAFVAPTSVWLRRTPSVPLGVILSGIYRNLLLNFCGEGFAHLAGIVFGTVGAEASALAGTWLGVQCAEIDPVGGE